jgi:PAS domain S-box-containing protein
MAHLTQFDQRLATSLRERFTRRLSSLRESAAASNGRPLAQVGDVGRGNGHASGFGDAASVTADASLIEDLLADIAEVTVEARGGNGKASTGVDTDNSTRPELATSDTRYRSLLEISPDAIAILQEGKVAFVNESALRLVGAKSPDEILGRSLNEHIHPDDLPRSLERQRELASGTGTLPPAELRVRQLDGNYVLVETRAGVCVFHGAPAIQIVARDITERKREERYLEKQNRILERIATGAPLADVLTEIVSVVERLIPGRWCVFYLWDPHTSSIRIGAAPSLPAEYNAATDGLVLRPDLGSCGPAIHHGRTWITEDFATDPLWAELRDFAMAQGLRAAWSTPIVTRGDVSPADVTLGTFCVYSPTPHRPTSGELAIVDRAVHLARIAMENDRAQRELHASEARYRAFVEQSSDALFLFRGDATIADVNSRACERLEYSRDELLGATAALFDPLVGSAELVSIREATLGKEFHTFESRHRRKSGEEFPVEVRLRLFDMDNELYAVASARDISDRKRSEQALRESEARYRQLAEAMPQMVWVANHGHGIEYVNERARKSLEFAIAGDPSQLLHPDDRERTIKDWETAADAGTVFEMEHRIRASDAGEYRWYLTRCIPLEFEGRTSSMRWIGTTTDIHELKVAQNTVLAERDRLTRMAAIAPGVIHTIRVRPDGARTFEFVGESIEEVLGVTAAEVLASHAVMNRHIHPDDLERIRETVAESARCLSHWQCEYRVRHPRRREVWVEARSIPVAEPGGDILWHGFLADVTRRKVAEAALLDEHERLVETQAVAHLGYFEWDVASGGVLWSAELYRIFDLDAAVFRPTVHSFLERVHPEDRDRVRATIERALAGGAAFSHEERVLRPNGEVRYLESRGRVVFDSAGRPARMTGACLDITDRKLAEIKLADSEHRLRSLADGIPQIVWGATPAGDLDLFNARAAEYTGLPSTELLGWKWGSVIHPDDLRNTVATWTEVVRTGQPEPMEFRIRRHDGAYRWFLTRQVPIRDDRGTIQGWYGSCTDIHDAREALLAVKASQERLSSMIRNAPGVAIQFYDRAGRVVLWNAASEQIFGFTADEAVGRTLDRLIHTPDEFRTFLEALDEIERTGEPIGPSEYTFRRKTGGAGHCLSTLFSIPGEEGETWFVCVDVDVTERTVAEKKLRESETLLRSIIDNAKCAIWVKDLDGRFAVVNRYFGEIFRSPLESILGRSLDELAPSEVARESAVTDGQVLASKQPLDLEETILAGGVERNFLSTKFPILDAAGEVAAIAGVCTDITDHMRLEEQLRQAQKMEAIGQLAGGVAHDFNNMLLVINGYAEMLLEKTEPDHPQHAALAGIREAGRRASGLTNQLLAFSRKSPMRARWLNVNEVVTASESLLRRLIGEQIRLIVVSDPEVGLVRADRGHLEQVLLNLVVNARDAMPQGGEIRIETASIAIPFTAAALAEPPEVAERYVRISVSDTGCGMSDEVAARVFEPFFTTKEVGRGTGLGLSVVHGVVTQNGGVIRVHSEVGVGTTFEIFFPELVDPTPATPES